MPFNKIEGHNLILFIFYSSPKDVFIDFRGRGRERNIDQLPPTHALTRNPTHSLGMCLTRN